MSLVIKKILQKIKELDNKNVIHAWLNADTEVTTDASQNALVNFNSVFTQRNNKLSLQNGKITIGKGIKFIKVTSIVTLNLTNDTTLIWSLILAKNLSTSMSYQVINSNAQKNYAVLYNEAIYEVEEGDTINAYIRSVANTNKSVVIRGGICQTHIIVEEI